jgi:hypothetical protein
MISAPSFRGVLRELPSAVGEPSKTEASAPFAVGALSPYAHQTVVKCSVACRASEEQDREASPLPGWLLRATVPRGWGEPEDLRDASGSPSFFSRCSSCRQCSSRSRRSSFKKDLSEPSALVVLAENLIRAGMSGGID